MYLRNQRFDHTTNNIWLGSVNALYKQTYRNRNGIRLQQLSERVLGSSKKSRKTGKENDSRIFPLRKEQTRYFLRDLPTSEESSPPLDHWVMWSIPQITRHILAQHFIPFCSWPRLFWLAAWSMELWYFQAIFHPLTIWIRCTSSTHHW